MEKGFDGLHNHVTPNVSDEALYTRLQQLYEYVEEVDLTFKEITGVQREVNHITWELKVRSVEKVKLEEELAWMEKTYEESPNE